MVACSAHYLSYPFCRYIRLSHSVGQKCDPPQDLLSRFSRLTLYHHCFGSPLSWSRFMERHSFLSNQTIAQQSSFMFHAESSIFRAPEGRCMLLMFHRADPISLYISGGVSFILHLFSRELTPFPQDARYILPSREIIPFLEGFISHLSS